MDSNPIKTTPRWHKTKEQIWEERFEHLADSPKVVRFSRKRWFAAVAAAILALLLVPLSAYLYTEEVVALRGEHLAVVLPDGSQVELNADSRCSYKPYWWSLSRTVRMSGEAFFEVAKGKRFEVQTVNGTVTVLGTSFNVCCRGNRFDVVCLTGRVEVSAGGTSTILTPEVTPNHRVADWRQGKFYFADTPLQEVIGEIERQYNITVEAPQTLNYYYTGNFSKTKNPEDVLRIIEKPFGLTLRIR